MMPAGRHPRIRKGAHQVSAAIARRPCGPTYKGDPKRVLQPTSARRSRGREHKLNRTCGHVATNCPFGTLPSDRDEVARRYNRRKYLSGRNLRKLLSPPRGLDRFRQGLFWLMTAAKWAYGSACNCSKMAAGWNPASSKKRNKH
jgi:hypothetical protein